MRKIKDITLEKAELDKAQKAAMARARYYQYVAAEENCDLETAIEICAGRTDPQQPEYMLGFKICDPYVQIGLFASGKEVRERFRRHLEEDMTPAEIELFHKDVLTESAIKRFREELKIKRKRRRLKNE